jgi:hypothetical protein
MQLLAQREKVFKAGVRQEWLSVRTREWRRLKTVGIELIPENGGGQGVQFRRPTE